ncbi:MAG: hypothetical protein JNN05_06485 [Candidatus Omnitrophica bacterium]|nr:hypothetical protein [Candidatus Omnitrophota bacterium]
MLRKVLFILFLFMGGYAQAYEDRGVRDPFWPLVSASGTIINYGQDVSVSDMILEGIVSNGEGAYTAIINGAVVEVGDSVGQYSIKSIESQKVILSKENEIFELDLKKGGE